MDNPASDVVDGQQRLTTLTLLFCALREIVGDDYQEGLKQRLRQAGDKTLGLSSSPRLQLREKEADFAAKYLHEPSGLDALRDVDEAQLPEAQRNLRSNVLYYTERLSELGQPTAERLLLYLSQRTFLVVVGTADFDSAYRIFSVLNERGLDLSHSDVFKSEVIGRVPDSNQHEYTKRWEDEEEDLGRDDFADLFGHIRMVTAKTKQRETILKEFRSAVLDRYPSDGRPFIDDVLVPYSDAFETIRDASYASTSNSAEVNHLLRWLNELDNADWVPPAMEYMRRFRSQPNSVLEFLTGLDRLASSLLIRRVDLTRRIERYAQVLKRLETDGDLWEQDSPLQLNEAEKKETLARLNEDVYLITRVRKYVLLRLDEAMGDGTATYDFPLVTVEHVLPQNPSDGSHWLDDFDEAAREQWTHRLANLVLLSRRRNTQASNRPFDEKKSTYFQTKDGSSPFLITTQVLNEPSWTPPVLAARQDVLLQKLAGLWNLA
jgi:hypothetical protein